MRTVRIFLLALSVALLSACAGQPEREGVDTSKAAEANAQLGLRYMQNGNYELALKKLQRAVDFDDDYAPAHHFLAVLYSRLNEFEKADDHYREAIYNSENDYDLFNNYGTFLCSQKRYDKGEKQLLKVLKNPVYPRKGQLYENLGLCVEPKPDLERAENYFRQALTFNPRLPTSLLAMARITFSQGNYLRTRAFLERYREVAPHTAQTLWLAVRTERLLGDRDAVASYGLQLKANFPDADETKLYLQSGGN